MRFLQGIFTAERSYFLMTLRHPLGTAHFRYIKARYRGRVVDCGEKFILHWLKIYETAVRDATFVSNIGVIQLEEFIDNGKWVAQGYVAEMETFLGLKRTIVLHERDASTPMVKKRKRRNKRHINSRGHSIENLENVSENNGQHYYETSSSLGYTARKLLEYHGSKHNVEISFGASFRWVTDWKNIVDIKSPVCKAVEEKYEERLNQFGYSLRNLTHVTEPHAFRAFLLKYRNLRKN